MLPRVRSPLAIRDLLGAALERENDDASSVERLEHAFAARFGFPHGVLFRYARSGLHALLSIIGWRDQEILSPAYCCGEVAYAITASGNRVRFVDSAVDHFLPGVLEWRSAATQRSAAAIVTPLFGYPVAKEAEAAVRTVSPNVFVIYDEAQSYGAADADGLQSRDADAAIFSLGLGKMITGLGGGMVLVRDVALQRQLKDYRDRLFAHPSPARTGYSIMAGVGAWAAFREPMVSMIDRFAATRTLAKPDIRYRTSVADPKLPDDGDVLMPPYQARVGLRQLERLGAILRARRAIGGYYERRLREEGLLSFPYSHPPTWPRYPLPVEDRAGVIAHFRRRQVQVSDFLDYSCPELPSYRQQAAGAFPHAALWARSMINLPIWHGIDEVRAERVVSTLARLRDRGDRAVRWPTVS